MNQSDVNGLYQCQKKRNLSSLCQRAHREMSSITPSECSTKDMFFSFTFVHFLKFSHFLFLTLLQKLRSNFVCTLDTPLAHLGSASISDCDCQG